LDLSFVSVPFPLRLYRCRLTDDANLISADLPALSLAGSRVLSLTADRVNVKGSVFLRDGFSAEGEVRLVGAQIGDQLDCSAGTFKNPGGPALSADGTSVKGSIFLSDDFGAEGEVGLRDAQIGGTLHCVGGKFKNPGKDALSADRANVKGGVFLTDGFGAEGTVRLLGAQIGGNLECDGGTFRNPGEEALGADGADVKGSLFLRHGFSAIGGVRLLGAQIGGNLDCGGGSLSEVIAENAEIRGTLLWQSVEATSLDLINASAGSLVDDEKSWPGKGNLFPDGFVYGHISGDSPRDAKTRLKWLALQDRFVPQPYRQLAKVLRETGDEDGAVTVLQEMERLRRKRDDRTWPARLESGVLRRTIGYGYNPLLEVYWMAGLSGLGWILYRRAYLAGNIVPKEEGAYESFKRDGQPPDHYTTFAPLVYAVENSLPLVKLGQEDTWHPEPNAENAVPRQRSWPTSLGRPRVWARFRWLQSTLIWSGVKPDPNPGGPLRPLQRFLVFCGLQPPANREAPRSKLSRWLTSPRFLHWFLWIQILLGWLLATLFLAGVTGVVRKE
jgi:hypothetical protein